MACGEDGDMTPWRIFSIITVIFVFILIIAFLAWAFYPSDERRQKCKCRRNPKTMSDPFVIKHPETIVRNKMTVQDEPTLDRKDVKDIMSIYNDD